jgi:D-galactonate transporter
MESLNRATKAWQSPPGVAMSGAYRKVTLRLIPLLFLAYICNYLDRVNIGFAQLEMGKDLHFSAAAYGLGAGIFFIGYFLLEVPSNLLLQRVGARAWIARIMISWGAISALMLVVHEPWQFYLMRFLLGAAEAGFFPGVILYLTYWYSGPRRARATAFFFTATPVAGIVGGPLSGWILHGLTGIGGLRGWQWLFLIEGAPAVLVGLLVLAFLPDRPATAQWLTDAEKSGIQRELDKEASHKSVHSTWSGFKDGRVLLLSAVYFCFVLGSYGIAFWLPAVIKSTGVADPLQVGFLSAIPWAAALVLMVLGARSSDRTGKRRLHVGAAACLGGTGLVIVSVGSANTVLTMLGLALAAAGVFTALPLFWSLPTAFLSAGAAAVGLAVINSLGNLAGFVANFLVGWLVDSTGSSAIATLVLAGFLLIGTILMLLLPRVIADSPSLDARRP